jgi:hypothetical protein
VSIVPRGRHLIAVPQSIVPEVNEEEEEEAVNSLSAVLPNPEQSPKTFKRGLGLVELVLVSGHYPIPSRH